MSLNRWAVQRDKSEPDIVLALEQVGAQVLRLDAFDLLVLFRGELFMLEAKVRRAQRETAKGRYGRKKPSQERLIAEGWPLRYVTDKIEALKAIGAVR